MVTASLSRVPGACAPNDRFIMGLYACNLMEWGQYLYRNDNFLALLAAEPNRATTSWSGSTEHHLKGLDKFLGWLGLTSTSSISVMTSGSRTAP